MTSVQTEIIIRNIIKQIVQECVKRGQIITETLAAFMIKAVILHPDNEFSPSKTLNKDDINILVEKCVKMLLEKDSPMLEAIKMQVFFDMNYSTREQFMEEHRKLLNERLSQVMREILDARATSKIEFQEIYRKIITLMLLKSGLGSPTNVRVVREATCALQSIFPAYELPIFIKLNRQSKLDKINSLTSIVSGIRLMNKQISDSGEGIDDLPTLLMSSFPTTIEAVQVEKKSVSKLAALHTSLYLKMRSPNNPDKLSDFGLAHREISSLSQSKLLGAITNLRQHYQYLGILEQDLLKAYQCVDKLVHDYNSTLSEVIILVKDKVAIPTGVVYVRPNYGASGL
ncbi:hypothetical protein Ciccas_001548 [Cichlidogyrus casuarinus]|uniref:Cilia- and flagella-associated protein 206 n=1 Tax=Cichlidogyrus casuarinus TaxID=1844966 RepID=A0ABD2QKW8_9PLAT